MAVSCLYLVDPIRADLTMSDAVTQADDEPAGWARTTGEVGEFGREHESTAFRCDGPGDGPRDL